MALPSNSQHLNVSIIYKYELNMIFYNRELARRKALKSTLVGSILLFNMKSSLANQNIEEKAKNNDSVIKSSIQLAKNKVCPSANLLPIRSFSTAKNYVYICRGNDKNPLGYYVRIPNNLDNKITVPITKKARETYTAINGELAYIITPYEMFITKRGLIIHREKVITAVKANGKSILKGCPKGNNTFAQAETKSFFIYICGQENPSSYISVTRKSNKRINLPLTLGNQNRLKASRYIATNGNIRFILTDKALRVSRDGRNVVKEKVLNWEREVE
ncbi:MAG: hypothetical protein AAGG00_06720 [Cyanobacteria bacterium P01_H01_bin.150]